MMTNTIILITVILASVLILYTFSLLLFSWKIQVRSKYSIVRQYRIISLMILLALEFATTMYDVQGPMGPFPLVIRIPVLASACIVAIMSAAQEGRGNTGANPNGINPNAPEDKK